jgi:hemerythrin-like domain-containing protein
VAQLVNPLSGPGLGLGMADDAIDLLKEDHKNVKNLFKEFHKVAQEAGTEPERKQLAQRIVEELTVHSWIEEQVFYPRAAQVLKPEEKIEVLESVEEHSLVKQEMAEIEKMPATDERFAAKVEVLGHSVIHHAEEEEDKLLPHVKRQLSRDDLQRLGEEMARAKTQAPRSPSAAMGQPTRAEAMTGGMR